MFVLLLRGWREAGIHDSQQLSLTMTFRGWKHYVVERKTAVIERQSRILRETVMMEN